MSATSKAVPLPRSLRVGAAVQFAGYAALLASLLLKNAHAIAILLPLGTLCLLVGVFCWAVAAFKEARSKGMV